jgi:hypothetical protein
VGAGSLWPTNNVSLFLPIVEKLMIDKMNFVMEVNNLNA